MEKEDFSSMKLVLYQPEIPQNVGTLIRFSACMGIALDIIEPCGFLFSDKHLKRSAMDYLDLAPVRRFISFEEFCTARQKHRFIAVTAQAPQLYTEFSFLPTDCLIVGTESTGLPPSVLEKCGVQVRIPMLPGRRSLNVAVAAAIVTTEALRQTHRLPGDKHVY